MVRQVMVRFGRRGLASPGKERLGQARHGRQVWFGQSCYVEVGKAGRGSAGVPWQGKVSSVQSWFGSWGMVGRGLARRVWAGYGSRGQSGFGRVGRGMARLDNA
jgi:hypothetical protein